MLLTGGTLEKDIRDLLGTVQLWPRRLLLDTPGVEATVPMLRGVWGRALLHLDPECYDRVFTGSGPSHSRTPAYLFRPAPPDPVEAPAVDWILFGYAIGDDPVLMRAWDIASGMGLGSERHPFRLLRVRGLSPAPQETSIEDRGGPWRLAEASWPLAGDPVSTPCRLRFHAPVRLIRSGRLLGILSFADIVRAAWRRVEALVPEPHHQDARSLTRPLMDVAKSIPQEHWTGSRVDFVRWSGSQKAEIDLHGVAGTIDLPEGPGPLWPLLAAVCWTHIGKGTIFGLGQPEIEPIGG